MTGPSIRPTQFISLNFKEVLELRGQDDRILIDPGLRRDLVERRNDQRRYDLGMAYGQLARNLRGTEREAMLMKGRRLLTCGYYLQPRRGIISKKLITNWAPLHCRNRLCPNPACSPNLGPERRLRLAGLILNVPHAEWVVRIHIERPLSRLTQDAVAYRRELDRFRLQFGRDRFGKVFNRVTQHFRVLGLEIDLEHLNKLGARLLMVVAIKDKDRVAERLITWSKQYGVISRLQEAGSWSGELDAGLDWVYQVDSCFPESQLPAKRLVTVAEALTGLRLVTTSNRSHSVTYGREVLALLNSVSKGEGGHDIGVAQLITKGKDSFGTNCAIGGSGAAYDAGLGQSYSADDPQGYGAHSQGDRRLGGEVADFPAVSRALGGAEPSIRPADFETDLTGVLRAGSRKQIHEKGWKFPGDPLTLRGVENFYRARQVMQRTAQGPLDSDNRTSTILKSARREERERDVMVEKVLHEIRQVQGGQSRKLDNLVAGQDRILQLLTQLILDRDSMPDADYRQMVSEVETLVGRARVRRQ